MATTAYSTILPFTPIRENNNHSDNNNYYYIRAREDITNGVEQVAEMYQDALGRRIPAFVVQEVLTLLSSGIQADMICAVLAYTAAAPRPSWIYARTVIEKQAAMGARTAADFNGNCSSWRAARARPKAEPLQHGQRRVIEQAYGQRQYGTEYDEMDEEQLEAMRHG